jgi:DNA replication protein DnaC
MSDLIQTDYSTFGEALQAARERRQSFIEQHGEDAWNERIAEMKRKSDEEHKRREAEELSLLLIEKSGLRECIDKMTFKSFVAKEDWQKMMLDKCRRFIGSGAKGLIITGQPGCGKTHLGTAVCGHFIKSGRSTRYTTYQQLMTAFKAAVNDDEAYQEVLNEYGRCAVLYIDDFMKFKPSESDVKHTFELINMRLIRQDITIITSERSLSEIMGIDEALGSRIKQMCGEFTINIAKKDGRNYRL